jgi:hypothetical protein
MLLADANQSSCQSFSVGLSTRITFHAAPEVTVLLLNIKGFKPQCAEASVGIDPAIEAGTSPC